MISQELLQARAKVDFARFNIVQLVKTLRPDNLEMVLPELKIWEKAESLAVDELIAVKHF